MANDYLQKENFAARYKNGDYAFPIERNPEKKSPHNKSHYLAAVRYGWGRYAANGMGIGFGGVVQNRSISELRSYGAGKINVNKYKPQLDPKWENEQEKLYKISWDIVDVYTKLRNIAISRVQNFVFKPSVRAVNQSAYEEKLIAKNKEKLKFNPEFQQVSQALGQAPQSDFENEQDIDVFEQLGGFELDVEIGLKDAIDEVLMLDQHDTINDMKIRDIIDLNCCAGLVKYDPIEKRIKTEYLDPARTFWTPSEYFDCRDSWYKGTWKLVSIGELRSHLQRTGQYDGNTEEILEKSADNFHGYMTNAFPPTFAGAYGTRESFAMRFGYYHYNHFKVPVLTAFWKDTDSNTFVKGTRIEGNSVYKQVKDANIATKDASSTQAQNYTSKEVDSVSIPMVYKASWIIGSDFVYDCGVDAPIVRVGKDGAKIAEMPIVTYCNYEPSITARAIPVIDDLMLVTYKMRHSWMQIPSAVINDYDLKLLETSIQLGNQTMGFMDLINLYNTTGTRILASKSEHGDPELGSNRPPVQTQVHPALDAMFKLKQIWLGYVDDLRSITGVNEMSDGTQQSPEMLVGVGQMLEQSTNNALKPYIDAMRYHTEGIYRIIGYKYQSAVVYGDIERSYFKNSTLKKYQLDKRILSYEFNISISSAWNNEQKQAVIQFLQEQKQQGKVNPVDVLKATNFILNDDYAKAQLYLATAIDKGERRAHQMMIEQSQAQAKANQDAAVAASEGKISEIMAQKEADKELAILNHQLKLKEIEAEKSAHVVSELSLQHNLPQKPETQTI